jgi:hypothetical protein
MRATALSVWLLVFLSFGCVASARVYAGPASDPTVLVLLENHAGVPRQDLRAAIDQATRAFTAARIVVRWRDRAEPLQAMTPPVVLTLILLSPDMVARKCAAEGIGPHVLARSAPTVGRAWIFIDRIAAITERWRVPARDLLGRVLTHEVGHLLLKGGDHAAIGVMQETITYSGAANRFTAAQSAQMRRVVGDHSGNAAAAVVEARR